MVPQEERDVERVDTLAGRPRSGSGKHQRICIPGSLPGSSPCATSTHSGAAATACDRWTPCRTPARAPF